MRRQAQMPRIQKHPAWRSSSVSQASISRNSRSKQAASLSSASCRISAHLSVDSLPQLGQQVRDAVRAACHENLGVSPTVNVHIEDLHDDD